MELTIGIILLLAIYVLYKLFIDGWLFKIILFIFGFFGMYVAIRIYYPAWATDTAVSLGPQASTQFSYAIVIPSIVCFLCLLCTRVNND